VKVSVGEPNWRRDKNGPEQREDVFIDGTWWPVGHEDLVAHGRVSAFGDGSVWLDIDTDPWQAVVGDGDASAIGVRTLFGHTAAERPMSLHGVRFVGGEADPGSPRSRVRYVADRLVYGIEAATEDDVYLQTLQTSFRGLREWLMGWTKDTTTPLPCVRPVPSDEGSDGRRLSDERVHLASFEVDDVRIQATVAFSLSTMGRFTRLYETSATLLLEATAPLSLTEWKQRWIEPLRDLVLFGTREQTVVLFLTGHPDARCDPLQEIRVYEAPDVAVHQPDHVEYHQRDLLPAGIWEQEGFSDLIAEWRKLHADLGAVARSLFEVLNSPDIPLLTRLLRLTSCAEGYHRALHDDPPFTDEEHAEMLEAMIDALPEKATVRKHYEGRLAHANSQSQRARIRWLIERAAEADDRLEGHAAKLTSRLVEWRNDHTHLPDEVTMPPLHELLLLNAVLTYVLEANVLLDLGIGENTKYCLAHGHSWDDPIPAYVVSRRT